MSYTAHKMIKLARESCVPKMTQIALAERVGVSESTVKRWESGEVTPDPDDIYRIEKAVGATMLWHMWMSATYISYRAKYSVLPCLSHISADISRTRHEISDAIRCLNIVDRDAIDGVIDDIEACKCLRREGMEAIASISHLLGKLPIIVDL